MLGIALKSIVVGAKHSGSVHVKSRWCYFLPMMYLPDKGSLRLQGERQGGTLAIPVLSDCSTISFVLGEQRLACPLLMCKLLSQTNGIPSDYSTPKISVFSGFLQG